MEETATVDQQLDELFGTTKPAANAAAAAGEGEKPPTGEKPPAVASPPGAETPTGEEDPLLKALEAIEEDKPAKPADDGKPAISDDQKAVLEVIPDVHTATKIYEVVQNYTNFTDALGSGKFDAVETMLTKWDPGVLDGWVEYIYKKHAEEFVDRFIAENDPNAPKENKQLTALQKKVQSLEASLEEKKTVTAQSETQKQLNANFKSYNDHVDSLFEQIKFNKADRKWVTADLNQRIASDQKVLAAIKSGNPKAVNPLFKAACREYLTRDKEVTEGTENKIRQQERKQIPLGGGAAEVENGLPDDLNKVEKKDLDKWQDNALTNFLGKMLGKKK